MYSRQIIFRLTEDIKTLGEDNRKNRNNHNLLPAYSNTDIL